MQSVSHIKPLGFTWEMYDPFLFCAHHKDHYPKGNSNFGPDPELLMGRNIGNDFVMKDGFRMYHGSTVPGFPVHPHRGFETITITLEGLIDHADSLGGAGRYGFGDVQWMTAGKGIQHTEMFPLLNLDGDNPLELFQIWLNLPSTSKFVDPYYKMLWNEDVPTIEFKDETEKKTSIRVIAGNYYDTKAVDPTPDSWAANPENEIAIWLIKMESGAKLELPTTSGDITRAVYFYKGNSIEIDETIIPKYHQAKLDPSVKMEIKNAEGEAYILLVQGKAINEPVAQYGPFVMNNQSEIQQAFDDFNETKFGGWPWDRNDPVHGSEVRRFSKFADGEEEKRA
jgi:redox-sensitive bicupin YhaK (pirin superfamily)